jgi:hypothetical protein
VRIAHVTSGLTGLCPRSDRHDVLGPYLRPNRAELDLRRR